MWGTSVAIVGSHSLAAARNFPTQQLARIDYARPETWSFFFWAQINTYVGLGGSKCDVFFDLNLGLGRSTIQMPSFEHFVFENAGTPPAPGTTIYSTQVAGPTRFAGDTTPNVIDDFCAQSINVNARLVLAIGAGASIDVNIQCYAGFAPLNHVRPEWFMDADPTNRNKFRGGENGGM
jgi:hypothetical protein